MPCTPIFNSLWPWKPWLWLWCARGRRGCRCVCCWGWWGGPGFDCVVRWISRSPPCRSHVRPAVPRHLSVGFMLHLFFVHPDIFQCHSIPLVYPCKCLSVSKQQDLSDTLKSNWCGRCLTFWRLMAILECGPPKYSSWGSYHEIYYVTQCISAGACMTHWLSQTWRISWQN
jgi:hypothetical protein